MIAHNAQIKGLLVKGAVRRGRSLLAGVLRCGHCGRRLHVTYSGTTGYVPRYGCRGAEITHGAGRCISFGGLRVDEVVDRELVRVLMPGAIDAALATTAADDEEQTAIHHMLDLELREARYEADRARRQYDAVEPEHRLVAETLEQRWNAALARVQEIEARVAAHAADTAAPRPVDREGLRALAEAFPAVWATAPDIRLKKRIVRLLIEEIIAKALSTPPQIELLIHWKGGKHTELVIPRNRKGHHRYCTDRAIVDVVRDLARSLPDAGMARVLNRLGYRTGAGNTWTQSRVTALRSHHRIVAFDRAVDRPTLLTIAAAATALEVSPGTVRRMIATGLLPATQPALYAPWSIQQQDLHRDGVQRAVAAVKRGGTLPRTQLPAQLTLDESTT